VILPFVFGLLGLASLFATIRLIIGPSLADRALALDMLVVILVVVAGAWSVFTGDGWYLDAALVMALISFFATIAFARYIERGDNS
jgi:multicomponent Na+:H+ antiporter subunit F